MIVFIVPYRDREQQKKFFDKHMTKDIMEDKEDNKDYIILYIHQKDERPFNRGAMKNIGLKVIKDKYPNTYKTMTLVFNDIDVMPYTKDFINYETKKGVVKHYYGYRHTLGGIVSINAEDFENIDGFPNFWTWGFEDLILQGRVQKENIVINREEFYNMFDKNMMMLVHSFEDIISDTEMNKIKEDTVDGYSDIKNLKYECDGRMVNVTNFNTKYSVPTDIVEHDRRKYLSARIPPKKMVFR